MSRSGTAEFQSIASSILLRVDHRWKLQKLAEQIHEKGGHLSYGSLGEHFGFHMVLGDGAAGQVEAVLKSHLDSWQVGYEQALQVAIENLAAITDKVFLAHDVDKIPQCYASMWQKGDHAARFLLTDLYNQEVPGKAVFIPIDHGKIFIVGDQSQYAMAVALTDLYKSELDGFWLPPFGVGSQGKVWPQPSHLMYPIFHEMQQKYLAGIYEEQRQALTAKYGNNNQLFIAKFFLSKDQNNVCHSSATVTETVKATLLPVVDRVHFHSFDLDSETVPEAASASWDELLQLFPDRLHTTEEYPARYIFEGFPGRNELALLSSNSGQAGQ